MTDRLTPMQSKILAAMRADETGFAAFTGEAARKFGFAILQAKHGGIIIRAYGTPEYFLKARGLIERVERNVPGNWYKLTAAARPT
jgi:hypothetical protein